MLIEVLKPKIQRFHIADAKLNYTGGLTLDNILTDAADLFVGEKVDKLNTNNGEYLKTYFIEGKYYFGQVTHNCPITRKAQW